MRIYERTTETAKKIRKVLKERFPDTTFEVRSSGNAVRVCWIDGVLEQEVNDAIMWMESKKTDHDPAIGYVWEGQAYCGAEYIFAQRELSQERREQIRNFVQRQHPGSVADLKTKLQWTAAEIEMIQHFDTEDLVTNQVPDVDTSPGRKRLFLVEHRDSLTAEQKFKYDLLRNILANCERLPNGEMVLLRNGQFIDATFAAMAQQLYPDD